MKKMKIYDCSNSEERPANRAYGGTRENSCVTMLKKYAHNYGAEFVLRPEFADILFTNDIFPSFVLSLDKPKVKRMDGVFWENRFKERNGPLNTAALLADHVIFISEFSKQSYYALYGEELKVESVVLNWVDHQIFGKYEPELKVKPKIWVAACTNWDREEKRLLEITRIIDWFDRDEILFLVGNIKRDLNRDRIIPTGYLDRFKLSRLLRNADAFLNLSYKDPAPKVVCEAVCAGLPVLYANSGGTPELVRAGVGIDDPAEFEFGDIIPELEIKPASEGLQQFLDTYPFMSAVAASSARFPTTGKKMLDDYFRIFEEVMDEI
jgi:glycosyltransferase involved in cell wall biosynthesis